MPETILDWDALSTAERQTFVGQVAIGTWRQTFPLQNDNDRLFLDLLASSPTSDWMWFFDGGDGVHPSDVALQKRIAAIFASRDSKPIASLEAIDWAPLILRVRSSAALLAPPSYRHPHQTDAFALFAALFSLPTPTRPARAVVPVSEDLPNLGFNF